LYNNDCSKIHAIYADLKLLSKEAKPFLVTDEINMIDLKAHIKHGIEFSLKHELLYRLQFCRKANRGIKN